MQAIFDYVLSHFCSVYQPGQTFEISYGLDGRSKIQIRKGTVGFFEKDTAWPEQVEWQTWSEQKIPFFFEEKPIENLLLIEGESVIIQADIIASAFYLLSGWQEFYSTERDSFNRFPYRASIQKKYNFVTIPVVNYYFDILKTAIEQAYSIELKAKLWHNKPFATCLTHDIDRCESGWKVAGTEALKKGNLLKTAKLLTKKLSGNDAWQNLEEVTGTALKFGAKSTFFFLGNTAKVNGHPNADYDVSKPFYQQFIQSLQHKNFEAGVHGSFGTSADEGQLKKEIGQLNTNVNGNRFHYLCFDPNQTPDVLEKSGLAYDATLGFAEHFGFRNSYCFPFRPFDFKNKKPYSYFELPLNLMDTTLQHPNYMQLKDAEILHAIKPMLQQIQKFNGCFTLLWHNENLTGYLFTDGRKVLEEILSYCQTNQTEFLTAAEACKKVRF